MAYKLNVTIETYAVGDSSCSGNPIQTDFEPFFMNQCFEYEDGNLDQEFQRICETTVGIHRIIDAEYEAGNDCNGGSERSRDTVFENEECLTREDDGEVYSIKFLFECGNEYKPVNTHQISHPEPPANPLSITAHKYALEDTHCAGGAIESKSYTELLNECVEDTFGEEDRGNKNICHNGTGTDQLYSLRYRIGTECHVEIEEERDSYSDGECIQMEWGGSGVKYPTKLSFTCSHPEPQAVAQRYFLSVKSERYERNDPECSGNPIDGMTEIDSYLMNECVVEDDPKKWGFKREWLELCESHGDEHRVIEVTYDVGFGCDAAFEMDRLALFTDGICSTGMVDGVIYPTKRSFVCGEGEEYNDVVGPDPEPMANPLDVKIEKYALGDAQCTGQAIDTLRNTFPLEECMGDTRDDARDDINLMMFCENVVGKDRVYTLSYQKETECNEEVQDENALSFIDGECFQQEWEEDGKDVAYPTKMSFTCSQSAPPPLVGGPIAPNPDQPPITPHPAENSSESGMSTIDLVLICILTPVGIALMLGVVYLLYKVYQLERAVEEQGMDGEQEEDGEGEQLQGTVGN